MFSCGSSVDAIDAGPGGAGTMDAAIPDADAPDAATADSGVPDSGVPDAGTPRHHRKVALVVYDPTEPGTGAHLSSVAGFWGADQLEPHSDELAAAIRTATQGHVDFEIVARYRVDEFPVKRDGFRYDWASYAACRADTANCHQPDDVSYLPILLEDTGHDLCAEIAAGTIDEVWAWGFDYVGLDEFAFKIPGDAVTYPPDPYNYWIYDGRKKDLPECGRTYFVMGWNALVPGGNALHSFGHRIESALAASAPARGKWGPCDGSSEWTDFACVGKDGGGGVAGCGNVHYPPNGLSDYDYGNPATVQSYCDDYANYPALTKATSAVSAATWSPSGVDPQWDYLLWWFSHLPRGAGSHPAGGVTVENDWWRYILCYDGPCPLTP